jgi:hypothetical protein
MSVGGGAGGGRRSGGAMMLATAAGDCLAAKSQGDWSFCVAFATAVRARSRTSCDSPPAAWICFTSSVENTLRGPLACFSTAPGAAEKNTRRFAEGVLTGASPVEKLRKRRSKGLR